MGCSRHSSALGSLTGGDLGWAGVLSGWSFLHATLWDPHSLMVMHFPTNGSPLSLPRSLCAVGSEPHSTLETWPPVTKVGDKWG